MATILFLEDENMIREVLSEYMVVAGHEVVTCERGDEAIKLIEEGEPFDLAVLDIRVPGVTGLEVLQTIKKERGEKYWHDYAHSLRRYQYAARGF